MQVRKLGTIALLLAAITGSLHAQEARTVAEILANHAKAVDPNGKVATVEGMKVTANVDIPAMGMSASMIIVQRRPNQSAMTLGIPNIGEMRQGFDGTTAWASDPMQGPRIVTGMEAAGAADGADFRGMVRAPELFSATEIVGDGEVDGEKCVKVKFTWKSTRVTTDCFSTKSWQVLESTSRQTGPQGEMDVTQRYSDFRDAGGFVMPYKYVIMVANLTQNVTITSIEFGEQPASAVEPPAEIKALKKP